VYPGGLTAPIHQPYERALFAACWERNVLAGWLRLFVEPNSSQDATTLQPITALKSHHWKFGAAVALLGIATFCVARVGTPPNPLLEYAGIALVLAGVLQTIAAKLRGKRESGASR
jgi:hypothetical protein